MYSFDPVGSYERETYRAGGSSSSMLQPLLDNQVWKIFTQDHVRGFCCIQIGYKNQQGAKKEPLSKEKAVSLVQDVFMAAAERDIYTGDGLQINIITASGTEERVMPLRRD